MTAAHQSPHWITEEKDKEASISVHTRQQGCEEIQDADIRQKQLYSVMLHHVSHTATSALCLNMKGLRPFT